MIRTTTLAAAAALALGLVTGQARADVFDFEAQTGDTTTFSITAPDGLTATFSSPNGTYTVGDTGGLYVSLTGNALTNSTPLATPAELDITFNQPVYGVTLDFALVDFFGLGGTDVLTSNVGSFTATVLANGLYPEGVLNYSGPAISELTLNSAYTIAIDNLTVPEPATFAVLATGLAGLAAARRRRRAA